MPSRKFAFTGNPENWERLENLFHAALEHGLEERRAFLDDACGVDTDLRRQVELLLANEQQAGSFLEIAVVDEMAARVPNAELSVGRQLGPYVIISGLGSGGMGEVYRAHDSRLGRDVAIKTLPSEFARDPDRVARFRREARTLASLNHPNIGAIYDLEQSDDIDCLVLELVDGETLRGPLPIAVALDYARQVAAALQAAHDKGLIHRDLKPANIKVTLEGRVKVLDFGLAKAMIGTERNRHLSPRPTGTGVQTLEGYIAGTPGYMSPEQARGEEVDKQTDTWAFGCLFYELLTGKRAFPGETLTAILEREPDWQALPAKTPAAVRELLLACLQKDAVRRPQTLAEARSVIEKAQGARNRWRASTVAATAALATFAVGTALWMSGTDHPPERSDWVQLTKFPDPVGQPALSPDGGTLTFIRGPRTDYGLGQIYVKKLPAGEPVELTHDSLKKMGPAFSPDGTRIAYTAVSPQFNWDTWVVGAKGGEPKPFQSNASGLTWAGRTQMLFSEIKVNHPMRLVSAREDRSGARDVYVPKHFRGMARRSYASPDGKWALLAEMGAYGNWEPCRVVPMDGSSPGRQVGPPGSPCTFGAWSPDGKWVYLSSKAGGRFHIWRQRFPDGRPQQFTSGITEEEGIAMASDGRSFITAVALESVSLWIHDARGERQISVLEGNAAYPKFSPDGKKLFYRIVKAVPPFGTNRDPGEVWVADLETGRSEPVAVGYRPSEYDISRDGRNLVMEILDSELKPRLWVAPLDRSAAPRQISNVEGEKPVYGLGGDIFFRRADLQSSHVFRTEPDGLHVRQALTQTIFYAGNIAPDGKWMSVWGRLPDNVRSATQLVPLRGGPPVVIGGNTMLQWSSSGDSLWLSGGAVPDGQTYIVPLSNGEMLPQIPPGGFHSEEEIAALPGARRLDAEGSPGPSLGIYAFQRHNAQRNLYRIPIP